MPVLHQPEAAVKWLDKDLTETGMKEMLDYQLPSEELEVWPVYSIRTTKPRLDHKSKTEPFRWENLPPLGNDEPLVKPTLF